MSLNFAAKTFLADCTGSFRGRRYEFVPIIRIADLNAEPLLPWIYLRLVHIFFIVSADNIQILTEHSERTLSAVKKHSDMIRIYDWLNVHVTIPEAFSLGWRDS